VSSSAAGNGSAAPVDVMEPVADGRAVSIARTISATEAEAPCRL
jgi:hypothetical protein